MRLTNYIDGEFLESPQQGELSGPAGEKVGVFFNATDAQLRRAKRGLRVAGEGLRSVAIERIVRLVQEIPRFYFSQPETFERLCEVSGCSRDFLQHSLEKRRHWCRNAERFLEAALGPWQGVVPDYEDGTRHWQRVYEPRGPVVSILPQNSDEESLYVIVQALLARAPILIRSSARGVSSLSAIELVKALHLAIEFLGDQDLEVVKKSIAVVNLASSAPGEHLIDRLWMEGATYVLFGSEKTVETIKGHLRRLGACNVVGLGTGFASAIVLSDACPDVASQCLFHGFTYNGGNECISTATAYIDGVLYEDVVTRLKNFCSAIDMSAKSDNYTRTIGTISSERIATLSNYLAAHRIEAQVEVVEGKLRPLVIELPADSPAAELPVPCLMVKRVASAEDAIERLSHDLRELGIQGSICCSAFGSATALHGIAHQVPASIIRFNQGTHAMNMFREHQGKYLLREFLSMKLIEGAPC